MFGRSQLSAVRSAPLERAADLLAAAEGQARAGALAESAASLELAVDAAMREDQPPLMADALRQLAVVCHHRDEKARAQELAQRSLGLATELGDELRAAQALNALAGFDFEQGSMDSARRRFQRALALGGTHDAVRGKVFVEYLSLLKQQRIRVKLSKQLRRSA